MNGFHSAIHGGPLPTVRGDDALRFGGTCGQRRETKNVKGGEESLSEEGDEPAFLFSSDGVRCVTSGIDG